MKTIADANYYQTPARHVEGDFCRQGASSQFQRSNKLVVNEHDQTAFLTCRRQKCLIKMLDQLSQEDKGSY